MGTLHEEWRINLHISPTTRLICFIVFAIHYKDATTSKITQFGALADQIQHMAAQKVGFTPWPIRYRPPNWRLSSAAAQKST